MHLFVLVKVSSNLELIIYLIAKLMMSQILFSFWSHIFTIILISSDLLSLLKAESYGIFGLKKNSEWFSIENPWEIVDFSGFFFYFLTKFDDLVFEQLHKQNKYCKICM